MFSSGGESVHKFSRSLGEEVSSTTEVNEPVCADVDPYDVGQPLFLVLYIFKPLKGCQPWLFRWIVIFILAILKYVIVRIILGVIFSLPLHTWVVTELTWDATILATIDILMLEYGGAIAVTAKLFCFREIQPNHLLLLSHHFTVITCSGSPIYCRVVLEFLTDWTFHLRFSFSPHLLTSTFNFSMQAGSPIMSSISRMRVYSASWMRSLNNVFSTNSLDCCPRSINSSIT